MRDTSTFGRQYFGAAHAKYAPNKEKLSRIYRKKRQRVSLWWACGAARRSATRRGALRASRVVAEGWVMRANSRGVIFQARLYRLWLSAIRPAVSNAWPNERSVWCDWSGYRIIFRIPLRAPFFARHKTAHFRKRRWTFRIIVFIRFIWIRS